MKKLLRRLRCKLFKRHNVKCIRKVGKGVVLVCGDCNRIIFEKDE